MKNTVLISQLYLNIYIIWMIFQLFQFIQNNQDDFNFLDNKIHIKSSIRKYTIVLKIPYLRECYQRKVKVSSTILIFPKHRFFSNFLNFNRCDNWILLAFFQLWKRFNYWQFYTSAQHFRDECTFFLKLIIAAWVFGYLLSDITGLNMTGSLYELDDYGKIMN